MPRASWHFPGSIQIQRQVRALNTYSTSYVLYSCLTNFRYRSNSEILMVNSSYRAITGLTCKRDKRVNSALY